MWSKEKKEARHLCPPWRQLRGKLMISLINSNTNATGIGLHLWEIDLEFAPGLPPEDPTRSSCGARLPLISSRNAASSPPGPRLPPRYRGQPVRRPQQQRPCLPCPWLQGSGDGRSAACPRPRIFPHDVLPCLACQICDHARRGFDPNSNLDDVSSYKKIRSGRHT